MSYKYVMLLDNSKSADKHLGLSQTQKWCSFSWLKQVLCWITSYAQNSRPSLACKRELFSTICHLHVVFTFSSLLLPEFVDKTFQSNVNMHKGFCFVCNACFHLKADYYSTGDRSMDRLSFVGNKGNHAKWMRTRWGRAGDSAGWPRGNVSGK